MILEPKKKKGKERPLTVIRRSSTFIENRKGGKIVTDEETTSEKKTSSYSRKEMPPGEKIKPDFAMRRGRGETKKTVNCFIRKEVVYPPN